MPWKELHSLPLLTFRDNTSFLLPCIEENGVNFENTLFVAPRIKRVHGDKGNGIVVEIREYCIAPSYTELGVWCSTGSLDVRVLEGVLH